MVGYEMRPRFGAAPRSLIALFRSLSVFVHGPGNHCQPVLGRQFAPLADRGMHLVPTDARDLPVKASRSRRLILGKHSLNLCNTPGRLVVFGFWWLTPRQILTGNNESKTPRATKRLAKLLHDYFLLAFVLGADGRY